MASDHAMKVERMILGNIETIYIKVDTEMVKKEQKRNGFMKKRISATTSMRKEQLRRGGMPKITVTLGLSVNEGKKDTKRGGITI